MEPIFELSPEELRAALEEVHRRSIFDLTEASDIAAKARQDLDAAVTRARAAGASWTEIGRAVGITRQAARERWSR